MKEITWEKYLKKEGLNKCSLEDVGQEEKEVGFIFPERLKQLIMEHGGEKPVNLVPLYENGKSMSIDCIYHAYSDDDKYDSETISFATSCLTDEDYVNYVPFSDKGNVFLALDYNIRDLNPPVVMVIRDSPPDDPEHRYFLADNFQEFLDKYTC